jgi:hypothetical protein
VRKSLSAVWRDAIRDSELDATTKLVAYTLSTYANGRGSAYPSRATIAAGAGISLRNLRPVDAALDRLEAAGFLQVDPPKRPIRVSGKLVMRRPGGKRATNDYTLALPDTAHEMRSLEWQRGHLTTPKSASEALKSASDAHESIESVESGGAGRLAGTGPRPEEECGRCGERRTLVDDIYCATCRETLDSNKAGIT